MEDKVDRVVVELGDGLQGGAVVRVHEGQVLDEEDVHDVGALVLVHGDPGVAALHDLGHGVEVQHGVAVDHEAVAERRHDILHRLGPELQGALDHVELLLHQVVVGLGDLQHLHQLLPVVHGADLLAEDAVEELADGPRQRESQEHEQLGDHDGVGPDRQAVPRAQRLGHDLPKNDDADGGGHHGAHPGVGEVVQEDGEGGVDQHVAEQQRAQQVVALPADGLDLPRVPLLLVGAAALHDAELHRVQRHQPQVEPAEHAGQHQQEGDDDDLQPDGHQGLLHLDHPQPAVAVVQQVPLLLLRVADAQGEHLLHLALAELLDLEADHPRGVLVVDLHGPLHHYILRVFGTSPIGGGRDVSVDVVHVVAGLELHEPDERRAVGEQVEPVEPEEDVAALGHMDMPVLVGPGRLLALLQPPAQDPGDTSRLRSHRRGLAARENTRKDEESYREPSSAPVRRHVCLALCQRGNWRHILGSEGPPLRVNLHIPQRTANRWL